MTKALGKEGSFAEGPSNSPRQRFFWKKILTISLPRAREQALGKELKNSKNHFFAEGRPSAKDFLKILKISLSRARPSAKVFKKNKKNYLPRASPRQRIFKKS